LVAPAAILLLLCLAAPATAQVSTPLVGLEVEDAAAQYLLHLQESWLQWMTAYYQDRPDEARRSVEDIRSSLDLLGFEGIPDLSVAAAARAVESARQRNFERARLGVEAADRLDPGRPETSFASSILAWEEGARLSAVGHHLAGWARVPRISTYRELGLQNLLLGALAAVLLAGGAFVMVATAVHGGGIYRAVGDLLGDRVPAAVRHPVVWGLLLWPLLLPGGAAWLLLYLSALLWAFLGWSQRVVIASWWLVAGLAPMIVEAQVQRIEISLSPPAHAVNALVEKRLYGGFFSDLGALRSVLPESAHVIALLGDLHREMGQWENARERYEQVLELQPEDASAVVNMGAYYFKKGDYGAAIQYFHRAAGLDGRSAVPYFNLSQAYSESYLFSEQRLALAQAREIDETRVNRWLAQSQSERIVTMEDRQERALSILDELRTSWRQQTLELLSLRRLTPLALPAGALALSLLFGGLLSGRGDGSSPLEGGALGRALRWLVPGLESMAAEEGGRAFLAILAPAACVVLLLGLGLGYAIPWGISPGPALPVGLGLLALCAFYVIRLWQLVRTIA
jgi:tetratricopeptide (TPR) repeat protein